MTAKLTLSRIRTVLTTPPTFEAGAPRPVSYTHLDVYKRQRAA